MTPAGEARRGRHAPGEPHTCHPRGDAARVTVLLQPGQAGIKLGLSSL
jgi:hypothetical protein